jgi:hypothetical protein
MRWCESKERMIKRSLINILSSVSIGGVYHHNLVFSTISKSSSSSISYWFTSEGIEFIEVAIDVAVFKLLRLLNRLISDEFSAEDFSIRNKRGLKRNLHAFGIVTV